MLLHHSRPTKNIEAVDITEGRKKRGWGGRGAQRQGNWRGGRGGQGSSDLTHYCWTHGICAHPGTECRTLTENHKKNSVWCNKMSGSERNCTWQVRSVPVSNPSIVENKTFYTSELLCSSTVDPPQHATIISKDDSGTSNNYWRTEEQLVLTDIEDTHNGPIVQLPNNTTMNATNTGNIPLSESLSIHAKKSHIFDGLHSA